MTSSQNDTPKSCSPKYVNQALPCLHYTNSTRLHPSLDPLYTYAINSMGIDDDSMRFNSCSYGVKLKKNNTNMGLNTINYIQEEQRRANSYIKEEEILLQSLSPNNIYTSNIKKIDDNMSFTSCSYGDLKVKEDDSNMGFNSSNIKEGKKRENYSNIEKEDLSSSQFCRAGSFDVSTSTKQDAINKDINFSSLISKPKSEGSMESLNANPIRGKASKSPRNNKKTHQKQIICVPMGSESQNKSAGECLHRDSWAWRKYGQKPIKGSPYPRGYYRCSSCKGCTARKQVERSRSDPGMLTITYTSGHNHPWQANQKNRRKLEATVHENSYSSDPHENFNSIHGSIRHGDNNDVKTSATDSPYNSMLEGNSPCIRGKYDIGNLQDEEHQNELAYFGLLEELPGNSSLTVLESAKSPFSEQHEDPITIVHSNVVDPFNLFNWSSNIGLNYYSTTK